MPAKTGWDHSVKPKAVA
jgi:hypothetical protein